MTLWPTCCVGSFMHRRTQVIGSYGPHASGMLVQGRSRHPSWEDLLSILVHCTLHCCHAQGRCSLCAHARMRACAHRLHLPCAWQQCKVQWTSIDSRSSQEGCLDLPCTNMPLACGPYDPMTCVRLCMNEPTQHVGHKVMLPTGKLTCGPLNAYYKI